MKILIVSTVLALALTTVCFCLLRKTAGKCAPLVLACAIVLVVFIAPIAAAQTLALILIVTMCFLAIF